MMILENYEIAIIGVGGTIVGTLIGSLITYKLSLLLTNKMQRQEANRRLINIFSTELGDIYPTAVNWPEDINVFLRSRFSKLQAAIGEFRLYLSCKERENFDQIWFEYYCSTGRKIDKNCQSYLKYMNFSGSSGTAGSYEQDGHKNLVDNVNKILAFAQKT